MPSSEDMVQVVHRYIEAFDRKDAGMACGLFAADATVEDPVGSPPHVGHASIEAFYAASMQTGAKLNLQGPVRTTASSAAFAFSVTFTNFGPVERVDVIDVFDFAADGKVTSMKAYFGPQNIVMRKS